MARNGTGRTHNPLPLPREPLEPWGVHPCPARSPGDEGGGAGWPWGCCSGLEAAAQRPHRRQLPGCCPSDAEGRPVTGMGRPTAFRRKGEIRARRGAMTGTVGGLSLPPVSGEARCGRQAGRPARMRAALWPGAVGGTHRTWSPVADPGQLSSLWMRRVRNCTGTESKMRGRHCGRGPRVSAAQARRTAGGGRVGPRAGPFGCESHGGRAPGGEDRFQPKTSGAKERLK